MTFDWLREVSANRQAPQAPCAQVVMSGGGKNTSRIFSTPPTCLPQRRLSQWPITEAEIAKVVKMQQGGRAQGG